MLVAISCWAGPDSIMLLSCGACSIGSEPIRVWASFGAKACPSLSSGLAPLASSLVNLAIASPIDVGGPGVVVEGAVVLGVVALGVVQTGEPSSPIFPACAPVAKRCCQLFVSGRS